MAISSALGSSALLPAGLGFRNVLINGEFRINQRAFTSNSNAQTFGFDRWQVISSGGSVVNSPVTPTVGNEILGQEPTRYNRVATATQSGSTDYSILLQRIEDVRNCAGQTVTVSFWARASSGTPKVSVEFVQNFGSGGSAESYFYAGQVTLTTTFVRYTVTTVVPSISGKTLGTENSHSLGLFLWCSGGSSFNARNGSLGLQNSTIDFWGVQLEQNRQPTPFEQRPIGVELSLCHRYYQRMVDPAGVGVSTGAIASRVLIPLYTKMRAQPTSTMSGTMNFWNGATTGTSTAFNAVYNSVSQGQIDFNGGVGTAGQANSLYTTGGSQYIDFSSEL